MTNNQHMKSEPSDAMPDDVPHNTPDQATDGVSSSDLDSGIIEEPFQGQPREDPHEDDLARVQVGAGVYASDGEEVAIVEIVSPGHVGIRAGQPGRPIDLPGEAIARVSPDGQRVDITLTSAQIELFSGSESTGADHLAGQMGGEE